MKRAFVLAVLVIACQPGTPDHDAGGPALEASAPETAVPGAESDSLRLQLGLPAQVRTGASVRMTLRMENIAGHPVDLYLRGRTIAFDLVVTDQDGAVVWRRLEDEMIPAILRIETLAPGAAIELEHDWDQRSNTGMAVGAGSYAVRGEILTEERPLVTPVRPLRIIEPNPPG